MFCKYCGEQISYTSKWCGHCGKESPPLYMYRKAVRRTEVLNSNVKPANSSAKSAENRDAGRRVSGDLKSFLENTIAVNEGNSLFNSEATQSGEPNFFYGEATQTDGLTFYDEATQAGGPAHQKSEGEWTSAEMDPDQTERNSHDRGSYGKESSSLYSFHSGGTANALNPAASFNRSGDLVGYPGEEDVPSVNEKEKKEPGRKKASRKTVRIIAGIVSGLLIAGLVGFGLGRIFSKSSHPGTEDQVQIEAESGKTGQEVIPGSEEEGSQDTNSSGNGQESTDSTVESSITESNESVSGAGQDRNTGTGDTVGTGGGVNHDTRDVVSEAIADTEGVAPGTASNITEKNVNGPNVSGDVQVNS